MGTLKADLVRTGFELEETHISWVFLGEGEVFKVKKPVSLGFLDFSTVDRRRAACEAEVRLNRRLAPDVYLGVVPVTRGKEGRHRLGGDGEPVDWAVRMRRLPRSERADLRLAEGRLGAAHLERIAVQLAAFHAAARADGETARHGTVEAIAGNVRENFEQTKASIADHLAAEEAQEIEAWQLGFLSDHAELLDRRRITGRVRDGHGDLRLEHVYLAGDGEAGEVRIIDCIEFNERFRYADVAADVAFLSMDLAWHGHAELAERFLALYARESGDFGLYPLVDFYQSYRAYVRGKVTSMLAADRDAEPAARRRAGEEARRYYLLALAAERRPLLGPAVVAVGGVIAAGKSTVAERIAAELSAPVVDSDRTRKQLLGVAATDKVHVAPWQGPYSPGFSERVYAEMLARAEAVLASGRPVVLDASFRTAAARAAARRLAARHRVPFTFVECRAEPELCRERLRRRQRQTGVSDGRLAIFDDFAAGYEAVTELPPEEHLILDTGKPLPDNVELLRRALPTWPAGLTG